jgi:hypothetical protein
MDADRRHILLQADTLHILRNHLYFAKYFPHLKRFRYGLLVLIKSAHIMHQWTDGLLLQRILGSVRDS